LKDEIIKKTLIKKTFKSNKKNIRIKYEKKTHKEDEI
jgi:hypothetical protein